MATSTMNRRAFLQGAAKPGQRLVFQPENGPTGDVLVVMFLRGGMDGAHVVPPHGDAAYHRLRPTLAVPEAGKTNGAVDLDGYFGLHPDMKSLQPIFQAGKLAIVHACGSPDSTLSHFEAMQTMERGVSDGNTTASGWISRHLASVDTHRGSPIRALALSDVLPKSMQGSLNATAVRSLTEFRLAVPEEWSRSFRSVLTSMYQGGSDPVHSAGRETMGLLRNLEKLDPKTYRPEGGASYPKTEAGDRLKQVAQLIKADVGLEIAEVDLGGWDSHVAQINLYAGLMKELSGCLSALYADLGDHAKRVTIVAMSEFGRRIHENSGLGTDHGRGTAMFLLGGAIRGGKVYGRWPGLGEHELDTDGNLRVTTDYRDVLSELVTRRLKNEQLSSVFPDYTPRYLGLTS